MSGKAKHSPNPHVDFCLHLKGHTCVPCSLLAGNKAGGLTARSKTSAQEVRGRKEWLLDG